MNHSLIEEQKQFADTLEIIEGNIKEYEQKAFKLKQETDDLYKALQQGDTELYSQLMTSLSILESTKEALKKNKAARKKPYFGRIDFKDLQQDSASMLYIGKNGISRSQDVVVVDWRAPVSSVYYENEIGEGSYEIPGGESIPIELFLKRTYDTDEGVLHGFYDNDTAANDDLLVKYLSQNKDAVLGDIISTIQKEQNEIIRDNPFKNIIVQGVAGSGKTTVAMHRISYILYNYSKFFTSNEFCIIGSNDMLLSYITSGLPELDVNNVKYMRMDAFFIYILGKEWKKKYKLVDICTENAWKSRLDFAKALDHFLYQLRDVLLPPDSVTDCRLGTVLSQDNVKTTIDLCRQKSLAQTASILNDRLKTKISFLVDEDDKELCRSKWKEYRNYFSPFKVKINLLSIYLDFIAEYGKSRNLKVNGAVKEIREGRLDVYDASALALIRKRLTARNDNEEFGQIIVDEAQDFGEMVYYVQKQILDHCYFTIMGDVSQNINYETGMNGWEHLKGFLFDREKDSFRILAKSYRNTIEISQFAEKVLQKASAGEYRIQPVIRHGKQVEIRKVKEKEMATSALRIIDTVTGSGYDTIAVICRTSQEADEVKAVLHDDLETKVNTDLSFRKGIMVLPIELTKGLEFDAVILWKPDGKHYGSIEKDAKLLYVAITRALHELYLLGTEEISPLFL